MKTSIFLPLRSGSQRVPNKHSKPFTPEGRTLFQVKMDEVVQIRDIDEVVISTNDATVLEQATRYADAHAHVSIDQRPEHLCRSTTKVQDLIDYVPTVLRGDAIFWLHATAPFVTAADYDRALSDYQAAMSAGTHDSLMSVNKLQQFIWDDQARRVVNSDQTERRWPNTQDLKPLYEINHAFYIAPRSIYETLGDRIGRRPALFVLDGEKKIDIDWESDFALAQLMYKALRQ